MPADLQTLNAGDANVEVVRFDSEYDNQPKPWSGPLRSLLGSAPVVRASKAGTPCFSAVRYRTGATRGLDGVEAVTQLVLDFDHLSAAQLHQLLDRLAGKLFAVYTSFSDRAGGEDDRCVRVVIVVTRSMTPAEYRVVLAAVEIELGVRADDRAKDASHIWYDPSTPPERADAAFITYAAGVPLDPQQYLTAAPPAQAQAAAGAPTPERRGSPQLGDAGLSFSELKSRLRRLRDEDSVALLGPVLAGEPFAEPGARNDTLWKVMSKAAFIAPEATPEVLVELVQPSLAAMAAVNPEGALTTATAADMAVRALRDADEQGIHVFERGDEAEIAVHLLDELATTEPVVHDEGQFWAYDADTGIWTGIEPDVISRAVQKLAGARIIKEKGTAPLRISANVVRGATELAAGRAAQRGFFEHAAPGFAFTNGFVRVDAAGIHLEPHNPEFRARAAYSFPFDPNATAPRFAQFRAEVFAGDPDAEQKNDCIQEFTGNSLMGRAPRQAKALVFTGEGRNGKSTYMDILSALFPEGAKEAVPPQLWENDYFRERLRGRLLNVVSELPKADILRSESFKAITAGDAIVARAIRQAPVRFRPVAGHLFAANTLPAVDDASRAFWARMLIVPFNNEFSADRGNAETDLAQRIISTELPGIAVWALQGAARLIARGACATYTVPASHHAALDEWRLRADQVAEFLGEMTVETATPAMRTSGRMLYDTYAAWAKREGHRPLASNNFGVRAKKLVRWAKPDKQIMYFVALTPEANRLREAAARRGPSEYLPDPVIPSFRRDSARNPLPNGTMAPAAAPVVPVCPPGPLGFSSGNGSGSNGSTPQG